MSASPVHRFTPITQRSHAVGKHLEAWAADGCSDLTARRARAAMADFMTARQVTGALLGRKVTAGDIDAAYSPLATSLNRHGNAFTAAAAAVSAFFWKDRSLHAALIAWRKHRNGGGAQPVRERLPRASKEPKNQAEMEI